MIMQPAHNYGAHGVCNRCGSDSLSSGSGGYCAAAMPEPRAAGAETAQSAADEEISKATRDLISRECDALREMLLAKQTAYGCSATNPLRIFSRADPEEQIRVRIDDKLSRLARGSAAGEDVEQYLMG